MRTCGIMFNMCRNKVYIDFLLFKMYTMYIRVPKINLKRIVGNDKL